MLTLAACVHSIFWVGAKEGSHFAWHEVCHKISGVTHTEAIKAEQELGYWFNEGVTNVITRWALQQKAVEPALTVAGDIDGNTYPRATWEVGNLAAYAPEAFLKMWVLNESPDGDRPARPDRAACNLLHTLTPAPTRAHLTTYRLGRGHLRQGEGA